ncbi:NADH dehydrogenase (ubiquinone) SGDH subunit [Leptinotarsa decemlineata]|uniref:NADH dehydrogenase (ubiquinone) SGDH subunit n=1 Tax=Leptinotarsa decemlineata TaxID=7539 RepID=UPI003D3074CC
MSILSTLRSLFRMPTATIQKQVSKRCMSEHRTFPMVPSRWQWNKFKDSLHYYFLLGIIPCGLAVTYANVFIGPATLTEIPEDYVPKYWEYYRNPVTRFIARYIMTDPQQDYEKYLCFMFMEEERRQLRKIERDIKQKLAERNDYQAYYYRPITANYHKITKEAADYLETIRGE